jgi:hypothetical protein
VTFITASDLVEAKLKGLSDTEKRRAILKDLDELKKARKKGRDEPDERSK